MGKRPERVDFKTLIRVPAERVFDALTTAEGLDAWFTSGTSIDLRPSGEIVYQWKNWGPESYTGEIRGKLHEVERPHRYVWQWTADSGGYDTNVVITLSKKDEGTMVRLVETGYEDTPEGMQDLLNRVSGWAEVLTLLKFYLEHGVRY